MPVFGQIKPKYTRDCLVCMTFNCFLSFFSQSEALYSSTLCPPYECRRTGRPPPPSTPHITQYDQHTYLPTHLRRNTYQVGRTDTTFHHSHRPFFYRPKDGKEDLGPHAYTIRNSSYGFHARVHGDLSVSIRLAFPYECGAA